MRATHVQCHDHVVTEWVEAAVPTKVTNDGYERALALVERNDMPAALRAIQEALANHDERCNVHNLAGYILKSLNAPYLVSASVMMFERSLELWPHHSIALENLSHALVLLGRSDLAIARLSQGCRSNGTNASHQPPSRLLVQRQGGTTAGPGSGVTLAAIASPNIDAAARDHAAMQVDVGEAQLSLNHLELAAEAFAAAIRADRTNFSAHQKLTTTLLELRWFHSALAAAHHGLVTLAACAGTGAQWVGAGVERMIEGVSGGVANCVASCVVDCGGKCNGHSNPESARTRIIAAHGIATVALQATGNVVPSSFDSAEFEIACENERPLAWLYRHDEPDIRTARHAVIRREHDVALATMHKAATVPHRQPEVILDFARWASRRAALEASLAQRLAWKTLEHASSLAALARREATGDTNALQQQAAQLSLELEQLRQATTHEDPGQNAASTPSLDV